MRKVISPKHRPDWRKIKAIVFQSDDWGFCGWSPDQEAYQQLKDIYYKAYREKGLELGKSTLEAPEDMERLFQVLERHRDNRGRHPIFQAAYIMANPDYEKIKKGRFKEYHDMVIPQVPDRWKRGDFIAKAREGIKRGVWLPVYHGNSHFNVLKWLEGLAKEDHWGLEAFSCRTSINGSLDDDFEYGQGLNFQSQEEIISKGLKRFSQVFGYCPQSAVLPGYVWQMNTEKALAKNGIKVIQGKNYQVINRRITDKIIGKGLNLLGYKSSDKSWQIGMGDYNPKLKLFYLNRNVYFEPWGKRDSETLHGTSGAYSQIISAWDRNEPAVIVTHRINYVYLYQPFLEENLAQLDQLLDKIQKNHPEAVYLTDYEVLQLYTTGSCDL